MSTKEKIYQLIDGLSDEQLNGLLTMLTGYAKIVDEAQDNAFCAKLYEEAKHDDADGRVNEKMILQYHLIKNKDF